MGRILGAVGSALRLAALALVLPACGGGSQDAPVIPTYGTSLSVSPVPVASIQYIEPLGHLNPVGHTLPTDHVYLYFNWPGPAPAPIVPNPVYPVCAPGPGRVSAIIQPVGTDWKLWVDLNPTVSWYLDHVMLDPSIKVGDVLAAGQVIGTTNPTNIALDLGLIDTSVTQPFVAPGRYALQTLHTASPFPYFDPPLRSQLYALVQRIGPDKDSAICFDQAGTLSGNWFEQSLTGWASADTPAGWPKSIAFAPDNMDPSLNCVSIGGTIALTGKWRVAAGTPAFASITPASGTVGIQLLYMDGVSLAGLLMVQMTGPTTVKLEAFPGNATLFTPFTTGAHLYKR